MSNKTAKLFKNGNSQAVRLPAEFQFDGEEVLIRQDAVTGDIILSSLESKAWDMFFTLRDATVISDEFMMDRPMNSPLSTRF